MPDKLKTLKEAATQVKSGARLVMSANMQRSPMAFLREVVRLFGVAEVLVREPVDPALQPAKQLLERLEVTARGLPHELAGGQALHAACAHGARVDDGLGMHHV